MGRRYIGRGPLFQDSEMVNQIVSSSSAGVTLRALGVSVLNTTATGEAAVWTLPHPTKGYRKVISVAGLGNSTTPHHVNLPSSDSGFQTSTQDMMVMATTNDACVLIGQTTAIWLIESKTTGVTFSTST